MPGLFISYRRRDSAPTAGRLYDRLKQEFGPENLFMDVDTIGAGSNFANAIEKGVERADALLVVVGDRWLSGGDSDPVNLLHDSSDYVRREVAAGIEMCKLIIPVLVDGAEMPAARDLPQELEPFHLCHAVRLDNSHFDSDFASMLEGLHHAMDTSGVRGAETRVCGVCVKRLPQESIKCPFCGHYREDVGRTLATVLLSGGLAFGLGVVSAFWAKDLPFFIVAPISVCAILLSLFALFTIYRARNLYRLLLGRSSRLEESGANERNVE